MRFRLCALLFSFWAALLPATAQADRLVVIELFTSQGCDRCPPVDALLSELAQRDTVLPLALHVDYWDYLGWKDHFALPGHVDRQMAYVPLTQRRRLFTPLMVIGGLDAVEGYTPMTVADLIEKHRAVDPGVSLEIQGQGDDLRLVGQAKAPFDAPADVLMVTYTPETTVQIDYGQNAGREVTYTNIVTGWQSLGRWDGRSDLSVQIAPPGAQSGAVFVQSAGHGFILAATRLP